MRKENSKYLLQDLVIIMMSVIIMIFIIKTNALTVLLSSTKELEFLGSFIAGLFFTSILTTAPAIAALGEISQLTSIVNVAFFGAIGAVLGDLIIFRFIRDRFSEHLLGLIQQRNDGKKVRIVHHLKFYRWLTFFLGGLIIASPLPDELGISLLGFSRMNLKWFIPVSFVFNFIGILVIGLVANAL